MKALILSMFLIFQTAGGSTGKVTLDIEKADINTVLRAIAKVGGVNIITTPSVQGEISVHLTDVPWREALYAILEANGFTAIEEENVIKVMTIQELENLKRTVRVSSRIFRIKYAKAEDLRPVLQPLLSSQGVIQVERRTNSLMVRDSYDRIEKIAKLIQEIDKPTPQVLIKAKIAKVDYKAAREIGIQWKIGNLTNPNAPSHFQGSMNAPVQGPPFKFTIGTIRSGVSIDEILSALEQENKAEVISEPSVVVADNEEAFVLDGKKIPIVTLDLAGNRVIKFYDVALKLSVTPHITPDSSIALDLHPELSDLSGEATAAGEPIILSSEVKTKLQVKNGETVVIGGIIRNRKGTVMRGVPFLSSLPVIGRFFTYKAETQDKTELMIFVTPTLVPLGGS